MSGDRHHVDKIFLGKALRKLGVLLARFVRSLDQLSVPSCPHRERIAEMLQQADDRLVDIETVADDCPGEFECACKVALGDRLGDGEIHVVAENVQAPPHISAGNRAAGKCAHLIEERLCIAHRSIGKVSDGKECVIVNGDVLGIGNCAEMLSDCADAHAVEVETLAPALNSCGDLVWFCRCEDEEQVCWWFLECLQ